MDLSLLALAKAEYGDINDIEPILFEFFAVKRKLGERRENIPQTLTSRTVVIEPITCEETS